MTDKQLHKKREKRKAGRKARILEKRMNHERMERDWSAKQILRQIMDEDNQRLLSQPPPKNLTGGVSINA